jgi:hypothetical protein
MVGDARLYSILYTYEEDFTKIFKVKADFDYETPISSERITHTHTRTHRPLWHSPTA